jgi:hypothetical protein
MIFVFARDDRGLEVFPTEEAAISYCEGVDVEDGNYMFWDSAGQPLEAEFTKPNERGRFSVLSGVYRLRPASDGPHLIDALTEVSYLETTDFFPSIDAIKSHLASQSK